MAVFQSVDVVEVRILRRLTLLNGAAYGCKLTYVKAIAIPHFKYYLKTQSFNPSGQTHLTSSHFC